MSVIKQAYRCAATGDVPIRSLWVALVAGSVLNLINQGDAVLGPGAVN